MVADRQRAQELVVFVDHVKFTRRHDEHFAADVSNLQPHATQHDSERTSGMQCNTLQATDEAPDK